MKSKLKRVLGIALTLVIVAAMTVAFAAPVAAGENEWTSPAVPASEGSDGDWFWDSTIAADGPGPMAQAIDGTLYVYAKVEISDTLEQHLFKSDDGRAWDKTDYHKDVDGGAIVDIACSSLDEDIVYVADAAHVYKTDDGGDTFDTVGSLTLTGEEITSVDVGYDADDSPYVFMGTKTTDGTLGHVYYYNEEGYGAGWEDLAVGHYDVYGLGTSPDFAHDSLIAALTTSGIKLLTKGDGSTAEWSTEEAYSGTYSVKLTAPSGGSAKAGVWYGKTFETLADIGQENIKFHFKPDKPRPAVRLFLDTTSDGAIDTVLIAGINDEKVTAVADGWFEGYVGSTGTWTKYISGPDYTLEVSGKTWSQLMAADADLKDATVMYVGYTYDGQAAAAYVDDVIIGGVTYPIESGAMVAINQGDVGVWDYLSLDTAGITEGSDPVFPEDFDADDAPDLFVGVAAGTDADGDPLGSVYRVDVDGGETYRLGDEDSDIIANVISLDVVGDYGATCLIAGTLEDTDNKVIYSTDDGDSWDDPSKEPSGNGKTFVVMDEDFDDSGIAWAACAGDDGAVSLTIDGGDLYNQISMIATDITSIVDVSFSTNYVADETRFMLTTGSVSNVDSLWRDDGSNWERVFTSTLTTPGLGEINKVMVSINFPKDETVYVADSSGPTLYRSTDGGNDWDDLSSNPEAFTAWIVLDADTVIVGTDDQEVWITGDHGRRAWDDYDVDSAGTIVSFSVSPNFMNDDTLLLGDDEGQIFISEDLGEDWDMVGDALDAATSTIVTFDPGYATNGFIYAASGDEIDRCEIDTAEDWADQEWSEFTTTKTGLDMGAASGLMCSADGTLYATDATAATSVAAAVTGAPGDAFTIVASTSSATGNVTLLGGGITVTWDTLNASYSGASGIWTISAIGGWIHVEASADDTYGTWGIVTGTASATITSDADGDANVWTGGAATGAGAFSLPDKAVAAVAGGANVGGAWRSLNPTDDMVDVVFELMGVDFELDTGAKLTGLRLTAGTNVLWSIDGADTDELWTYEDFLATEVMLDEPWSGKGVPGTDEAWLKWEKLTGADYYQLKYTDDEGFDVHVTPVSDIDELEYLVEDLDDGEVYYWKVRVQQDEPLLSRWSKAWSFTTKISAVGRTTEWMPENGAQDVILCPSFGWTRVSGATTYELELADNPDFTGATKATPSINSWVADSDLAYSTTYYWRTRALKDSVVISGWRSGAFTTMAKAVPPVEVTPAPAPQITLPAPQVIIPAAATPAWVWAIIGIGAALVIAVIVLVIRTRRAI